MKASPLWERYAARCLRYDNPDFSLDISRMRFPDGFFQEMQPRAALAFDAMEALEKGAISNPDENRMAGHYWLRAPKLAPTAELRAEIEETGAAIKSFAAAVHRGEIAASDGQPFTDVLLIGIGGSALGPQFIADALGTARDPMKMHFMDNTDPDGFDKVLAGIETRLAHTLVLVISKSGGTKETRNGMLETQGRFASLGIDFSLHAVAVTGHGSELDKTAVSQGWLKRFPMWDWVGGRTSIMSAVGLTPAALQGLDIDSFLAGAAAMDIKTRSRDTSANAAMLLALMWHFAGNGKGGKDMVILPYKDRLVLFSKYLQQLVMESLGKEKDLDGRVVNQGIAVYGNKGSTDQHAYVQQLREGVLNFFVTFIEVRKDRASRSADVEPGITSGDYLQGFLRGTRAALYEGGRDSLTLSIPEVNAYNVGALIALYERAVGFYASLVNINAYHQPGVEAGKKAATRVIELQHRVTEALSKTGSVPVTAVQLASGLDADPEDAYHILCHLSANGGAVRLPGDSPAADTFKVS